jgi:hypothetical protein
MILALRLRMECTLRVFAMDGTEHDISAPLEMTVEDFLRELVTEQLQRRSGKEKRMGVC